MSLNSRSASPLEPIAAVSPTPSSVFFVRSGATRRAFADPRQVERFTLVFLVRTSFFYYFFLQLIDARLDGRGSADLVC
jgi:hypothetical protein